MADERTIESFFGQDTIPVAQFANAIRAEARKNGVAEDQIKSAMGDDTSTVKSFFKNVVPGHPEYKPFQDSLDAKKLSFDTSGLAQPTLGPPNAAQNALNKYSNYQTNVNQNLATPMLGWARPNVEKIGDLARSGTPAADATMVGVGAAGSLLNPGGTAAGLAAYGYSKAMGKDVSELPVALGQFHTGMAQSLAEQGIDMSSGHGLGFLAMSLMGGGEAKAMGKVAFALKKAVPAILSGQFGWDSLKDLSYQVPAIKEALDNGDMVGAGKALGKTITDVFVVKGAAGHVARTAAETRAGQAALQPVTGSETGRKVVGSFAPEWAMDEMDMGRKLAIAKAKLASIETASSPSAKAKELADTERKIIEAQRKQGVIPPEELPKPATPATPIKTGKAVKPSTQAAPPPAEPEAEAPHPDEILARSGGTQPIGPTSLPGGLSTVKAKFSTWNVNFDDDIDRAAYMVAQDRHPQKKALSEFVQNATGLNASEVKMLGRQVRNQVGRIAKADGENETELNVPSLDLPQKRKPTPAATAPSSATPPPLPADEAPPPLPQAAPVVTATPASEPAPVAATEESPFVGGNPDISDTGRGWKKTTSLEPKSASIPEEIPVDVAKGLPGLSIIPPTGKLLVDKDTGEILTYRGRTGKNKHAFTDQRGNPVSADISDAAFKQGYGLYLGKTGGATPAPPIDEADVPVPAEKPKLVPVPKVGAGSTTAPKTAEASVQPGDQAVKKILDKETENGRFGRSYPFHVVIESKDGMPMFIKDFSSPESLEEDTDILKTWLTKHPEAGDAHMAAVSHTNVGRKGKTPIGDLIRQARKDSPVAGRTPAPPTDDPAAALREAIASTPSEPVKNETDIGKKLKAAMEKGKKKDSGVDKLKTQESGKDIIRGSTEIPLSDQGHQEAQELAKKFEQDDPAFTEVHVSPLGRAKQTAAPILDRIPNAQRNVSEHLAPWYNGANEGRPTKEVLPDMQDRIVNRPDEPVPGMSPGSTKPGESFNSFKNRLLSGVHGQLARWQPGQKILNITHYRDVKAMDAWVKAGAKPDLSIDAQEMIKKGDTHPGDLYRLDPQKMTFEKAADTKQDGIYFARHGSTEWNEENKGGGASKGTQAKPNKSTQLRRELYKPGNIVRLDYWGTYDKVLDYDEKPDGSFAVKVQGVNKDGTPIPGARPRMHSTEPSTKDKLISSAPNGPDVKHLGPVAVKTVPREDSLDPEVAATLAPGSMRLNPDGTIQELKRIPLNKVTVITKKPAGIPQDVWDKRGGKNTIYPEIVNKYATNPSPIAPEMIDAENGQYGIWDGHHRVEGARQRGDSSILAWVPSKQTAESLLGPPEGKKP